MDSSNQLRMMVYASLFEALTAVGAFLAIPIGPVPIVLQNMFGYLAGLRRAVVGGLPVRVFIFWPVPPDYRYLPAG